MVRSAVRLLLLALLAAGGCGDGHPLVSAPEPPPAVLLRDVDVLDVRVGALLRDRDVLVEGERIAAIGRAGALAAPAGARVIEGAGGTLLPGLIDLHGHVTADPSPTWERGLPDPEANLRAFLYAGITRVLDPGDPSGDAFERRAAVAAGELLGPALHTAGPIHTAPDGHPTALVEALAPWWIAWYLAPRVAVALATPADAREAVAALAPKGPDAVKIVIDRIPLDAPRMSREVAAAVVAAAREHDLRVVAHVGTAEDALDAAAAGVAALVHAPYKERLSDAAVAELAAAGIPVVATVEVFDAYARLGEGPREPTRLEREMVPAAQLDAFHPLPDDFDPGPLASWLERNRAAREARRDNVRRLHAAGVPILAGSDPQSGVFPGAALHRELATLVEAGLAPIDAIRAATLDAARFLTEEDAPPFGEIDVGRRADLLLVEGDPTADVGALAAIRAVLLGGVPLERTPLPR